jgi:hypothetical protein
MAQSPHVFGLAGEPLKRCVEYLIDPVVADVGSCITLVARNGSCPFYVGQEAC